WDADALPVPAPGPPAPGAGSTAAATLRAAAEGLRQGDHEAVRLLLNGLTGDWRYDWYRGIGALLAGEVDAAERHFDRVQGLVPGEAAPRLARGLCAELRGEHAAAARLHESVWRTDPAQAGAAFGLARARFALGERDAAVAALLSVPESSGHHADAQAAAIVAALAGRDPAGIAPGELVAAGERLERLGLTGVPHHRLSVLILRTALEWLRTPPVAGTAGMVLLGRPLTRRGVRYGLERGYRALARLSDRRRDRVALVELANDVRPKTLL
ncbi:tetratricopeptide repeat protein, partial [Spirillospora sp. NPDC029432]|uniref:tetratricopeptide repeat protein n=1 Tax=Spirillospora sp. NPDC029432 TaxID=3154599 RepID=UPI003453063D